MNPRVFGVMTLVNGVLALAVVGVTWLYAPTLPAMLGEWAWLVRAVLAGLAGSVAWGVGQMAMVGVMMILIGGEFD